MNILDLKRMLRPYVGPCGYNSDGGGGEGASNGPPGPSGASSTSGSYGGYTTGSSTNIGATPGSVGGYSPGYSGGGASSSDDGPMGPPAPSPAERAAADGISAQKRAEAVSAQYAASIGGWQSEPGVIGRLAKAHQDAGQGDATGLNPANKEQTVDHIAASDKVHRALNWGVPAVVGLANPGFGMLMSAARAAQAGTLGGFTAGIGGGMLGAATGIPGMAGFGSTLARNAVNGESTSMGDAVGSIASGVLGMEGSKAAGVVGSVVGGEAGRQIGKSINRN